MGLIWARLLNIFGLLIPLSFILFIQVFLGTLKRRRLSLIIASMLTLSFLFFAVSYPSYFVESVQQKANFLFYAKAGKAYILMPLMYIILIGLGIYESLHQRDTLTVLKRKQLNYVFTGLMIGILFGCTLFFYVLDIPIYPFGTFGIIVMKLIFVYAILKTELLEIKQVVSGSIAKWITLTVVCVSFFVLYSITHTENFVIPAIILALFWSWWARPLHQKIHEPIASKWLEGWYQADLLLGSLAQSLQQHNNNQEIAQLLRNTLQQKMAIDSLDCFYKDQETFKALANKQTRPETTALSKLFEKAPEVSQSKLIQSCSQKEQHLYQALFPETRLICPICNDEGLQILLLLGPKKSLGYYTETDLATFNQIIRLLWFHYSLLNPLKTVQDQLLQKEAHLKQVQDLAAFGTLTKGIAHEIKNPLNMMYNSLQIILNYCKPHLKDPDILALSESTLKSTLRLNDTVKLMLKLGQENSLKLNCIDLHEGLIHVITLSKQHCKQAEINLEQAFSFEGKILGNLTAIEQIFTNLIINSIEAIQSQKKPGTITIGTQASIFKQDGIAKKGVKVWVHDTGVGIEENRQQDIFKAFESSKYNNIGLGLSIVLQQVHLMKGEIEVLSVSGSTYFNIYFPEFKEEPN